MPRPSGRRRKRRRFTRRVKSLPIEGSCNGATFKVWKDKRGLNVQISGANPKGGGQS
jgi:hypothetical protein